MRRFLAIVAALCLGLLAWIVSIAHETRRVCLDVVRAIQQQQELRMGDVDVTWISGGQPFRIVVRQRDGETDDQFKARVLATIAWWQAEDGGGYPKD